jgi:spore maturation protein A
MMNYIWGGIMVLSMIYSAFHGNLPETVNAGIEAAKNSIVNVAAFAGILCLWSGIMRIAQNAGLIRVVGRVTAPVMKRLFRRVPKNSKAMDLINTNLSCNILGLGNAATPPGIAAMCELKSLNGTEENASHDMCMFMILNTASVQLIPTTMIALRAAAGSVNPADIVLPVWIVSILSVIAGILFIKLFYWIKENYNPAHLMKTVVK